MAGARFDPPLPFEITGQGDDGLSARDSLAVYVDRLAGSYAALSFMMRKDGRTAIVGRSFDSLRLGQLLVQEYCEDMHHFMQPGVHYLEFQDIHELRDIYDRLVGGDDFADVRRDGMVYFETHYSDDAILRHLATYV